MAGDKRAKNMVFYCKKIARPADANLRVSPHPKMVFLRRRHERKVRFVLLFTAIHDTRWGFAAKPEESPHPKMVFLHRRHERKVRFVLLFTASHDARWAFAAKPEENTLQMEVPESTYFMVVEQAQRWKYCVLRRFRSPTRRQRR